MYPDKYIELLTLNCPGEVLFLSSTRNVPSEFNLQERAKRKGGMLSRLWQPCQPKEGSLFVQLWTGPEDWLSISWWVVSFTVSVNWTNSCWLWTVELRQIGVEMPIECGIYSVSSVLKSFLQARNYLELFCYFFRRCLDCVCLVNRDKT